MDLNITGMLLAKNVALVVMIWNVAMILMSLVEAHAITSRGGAIQRSYTINLVQICICALFLYN